MNATSIREVDLLTRWSRKTAQCIWYMDDNGFLRGGKIDKIEEGRIYFIEN